MRGLSRTLICALALSVRMTAYAEVLPERGTTDARVRVVPYASDEVYRITGFVGYAIHIQLEEGETYRGLGSGDSEALMVDVRDSDVFLKPRAVLVETNLTLLTDRRRYHFDYRVQAKTPNPSGDDVIYSLRFLYPSNPVNEASRVASAFARGDAHARNADYWYCGHQSLRPASAFDDGVHTRIRFPSKGEIPAIFVRNEDASESLLNFSLDQSTGEIVVHRVAPRFILRRGKVVGCIVNRSYTGSGERLPSGTVTPDVNRETKGVGP